MHLDNSACNLASINLLMYLRDDNTFDVEAFRHTVELVFTAQEILVGYSDYPTESIAKTARAYRQLGLGYANLGALLMAQGLPYDSAEGRAQAAAITALMTGRAYATSAKIAQRVGSFAGFRKDREGMVRVLRKHREEVSKIDASLASEELLSAAAASWDEAVELGEIYGVRNSQASVLAPTGTIGLMMSCDTTGIEPDFALVKHKNLVGGGSMAIVNQTVPRALKTLGYSKEEIDEIVQYIFDNGTANGAPYLRPEHADVFVCAVGDNAIHYLGHVKMMAAVQPFISGAISKTVNMPEEATVEDVEQLHIDAWKMGIKAIAIYRDNCKVTQPLSGKKKEEVKKEKSPEAPAASAPAAPATVTITESLNDRIVVKGAVRRMLPRRRTSYTYKFCVADLSGFFTVGEYEDGTLGELFINVSKQGSTLAGLMDSFAKSVSHGLQYGVPLKSYVEALLNSSFAPSGVTDDPQIRTASSMMDYIFRRLAHDYLSFDDRLELGLASIDDMPDERQTTLLTDTGNETAAESQLERQGAVVPADQRESQEAGTSANSAAPLCYNCGNQTQRSGSCYVCSSCGSTTGCS
jgi:ribonucleoside-diphosphate reductase alpha chain